MSNFKTPKKTRSTITWTIIADMFTEVAFSIKRATARLREANRLSTLGEVKYPDVMFEIDSNLGIPSINPDTLIEGTTSAIINLTSDNTSFLLTKEQDKDH